MTIRISTALIAAMSLSSCAPNYHSNSLSNHVSTLIDETTRSPRHQKKAFAELQNLGRSAVPYIVGHLGDTRSLANPEISLTNSATSSFEGSRHYKPRTVHDALSAILNQITGKSFDFVYNGASPEDRERNRRSWIDWCKTTYPDELEACSNGR